MAVVDHERAWVQLQAVIASKSQHGREALLVEMATIASRCQMPEGELVRLLRLHGVDLQRLHATRDSPGNAGEDADVLDGTDGHPATIDRGGHDGSITSSSNGHGSGSNGSSP